MKNQENEKQMGHSRILKFRAWDNKEKRWELGYELLGGFSMFGEVILLGEYSNMLDKFLSRNGYKPEDLILMQFTGLEDKNGVLIYEGDIVMLDGSKTPKVMRFDKGSFILGEFYHGTEAYRMEVIGNIYENPTP